LLPQLAMLVAYGGAPVASDHAMVRAYAFSNCRREVPPPAPRRTREGAIPLRHASPCGRKWQRKCPWPCHGQDRHVGLALRVGYLPPHFRNRQPECGSVGRQRRETAVRMPPLPIIARSLPGCATERHAVRSLAIIRDDEHQSRCFVDKLHRPVRLRLEGDDKSRCVHLEGERQHGDPVRLLCLRDGQHPDEPVEPGLGGRTTSPG